MDPPGGGSERRRQAERLRREEAYYNFINELSEEEYRLMRDGNLLGTPGEVTAEELRQRLDGAKERVSSQPHAEQRSQTADSGEQQTDSSNGDSLLEWLNTFRRTGNATRSGQSGNQTWRAVSRTNPNSGEFRFSLEININHDQPEPGEHIETVNSVDTPELPVTPLITSARTASPLSSSRPSATPRRASTLHSSAPSPTVPSPPVDQSAPLQHQILNVEADRSPLNRTPSVSTLPPTGSSPNGSTIQASEPSGVTTSVSMETGGIVSEPDAVLESAVETVERASESPAAGAGSSAVRRHPTIMLDLQVRRIRPGENRDRDSIASRTRSRARVAENTVTFESDSGGFRRTISRSERAGIRTYVSTIRIPLRRISETGLGEPNSTALRSILRQIMTGFGELSSLMETEASSESVAPSHADVGATNGSSSRLHLNENEPGQVGTDEVVPGLEGQVRSDDEQIGQARFGGGVVSSIDGRANSRDTNNLVENGTLPILRLAHFFLLNDDEDDEHPRGLTKEQIDNLSTRTYGQASLEGEMGRACSVCINEYTQGNKLRRLPCSHEFHVHCIDRWLSENNTCPICRQPILAAHHD
uniref:RING-type E3 ubiquitin transferase n=1 Tax=Poecilia reticulata TaxID=8081 RepID=A0A3P9Q405_POERE